MKVLAFFAAVTAVCWASSKSLPWGRTSRSGLTEAMALFPVSYDSDGTMHILQSYSSADNNEATDNNPRAPRIVHGTPVSADNYPWMSSLHIGSDTCPYAHPFCGGSLIRSESPGIVLTAAHCLEPLAELLESFKSITGCNDAAFRVWIRRSDVNSYDTGYFTRDVTDFKMHSQFDFSTLKKDIGLVALGGNSIPVKAVNLMLDINAKTEGTQCCNAGDDLRVIGYGLDEDEDDGGEATDTLEYADLDYVDFDNCNLLMPGPSLSDGMLCAFREDLSACMGDSGGPLLLNGTRSSDLQVGIVSFGVGGCNEGFPGVFTDVIYFSKWINNRYSAIVCNNGGECDATLLDTSTQQPTTSETPLTNTSTTLSTEETIGSTTQGSIQSTTVAPILTTAATDESGSDKEGNDGFLGSNVSTAVGVSLLIVAVLVLFGIGTAVALLYLRQKLAKQVTDAGKKQMSKQSCDKPVTDMAIQMQTSIETDQQSGELFAL